jgi:hypothetical protein
VADNPLDRSRRFRSSPRLAAGVPDDRRIGEEGGVAVDIAVLRPSQQQAARLELHADDYRFGMAVGAFALVE